MSSLYPQSLQQLIKELSRLPGIGPKSAQRMAFYLLSRDQQALNTLTTAITEAKELIHACPVCGNYTDIELCTVCSDSGRDRSLLCLVEQARDIASMERSRSYNGLYHVLGGAISPMDGIGPDKLNLATLGKRLAQGQIREVIIATNPNVEGEATAMYLAAKIKARGIKVSRIAHGLPVGGDLEYADEATLALALSGRNDM